MLDQKIYPAEKLSHLVFWAEDEVVRCYSSARSVPECSSLL